MIFRKIYVIFIIVSIGIPNVGMSGDINGNYFIENCGFNVMKSGDNTQEINAFVKDKSQCLAIALSAFQQINNALEDVDIACYKHHYGLENYSALEIANLLFKYINNNPQTSSHPISLLTIDMLKDNFPIPSKCIK
jgi:hypothetical protein